MHSFDEAALAGELKTLANPARVAFAAAAAARLLGAYERFAHAAGIDRPGRPRELAEQLWADIGAPALDRDTWSERLEEAMALIPEEVDDAHVDRALAEDAVSALAYAVRCLLTPAPQEAAWAARRAYEAADQAAIRVLAIQPGSKAAESTILSHPIVQRELGRQREALALLRADSLDELRRRAFADDLLTAQEAAALAPP